MTSTFEQQVTDISIGSYIQHLRQKAGKSQRALSIECGLSPSYVSKVEAGELEPSLRAFAHIADVLKMTTAEILYIVGSEGRKGMRNG